MTVNVLWYFWQTKVGSDTYGLLMDTDWISCSMYCTKVHLQNSYLAFLWQHFEKNAWKGFQLQKLQNNGLTKDYRLTSGKTFSLHENCLMTAYWLHKKCLTTAWWMPEHCKNLKCLKMLHLTSVSKKPGQAIVLYITTVICPDFFETDVKRWKLVKSNTIFQQQKF